MPAVEGLRDGFRHGMGPEIAGQHRRPRDGLQRRPVRAGRQDQRQHHDSSSNTRKHGDRISPAGLAASEI